MGNDKSPDQGVTTKSIVFKCLQKERDRTRKVGKDQSDKESNKKLKQVFDLSSSKHKHDHSNKRHGGRDHKHHSHDSDHSHRNKKKRKQHKDSNSSLSSSSGSDSDSDQTILDQLPKKHTAFTEVPKVLLSMSLEDIQKLIEKKRQKKVCCCCFFTILIERMF